MTEGLVRQKGISLYRQVAMLLRSRVESGEWQAYDRLPSIEELSREFGVARVTVRQALQMLEAEGMVISRQGKGTFVQPYSKKWLSMQAGWQPLVNVVETQNHSVRVMASDMRSECPTLEGYPCVFAPEYRFQARIHFIKDTPYCLNDIYFDERIFSKEPELFSTKPVIVNISRYVNSPIETARQILTVEQADQSAASLLELPEGYPLVRARRIVIDETRTAVFSSIVLYPGHFIHMDVELLV